MNSFQISRLSMICLMLLLERLLLPDRVNYAIMAAATLGFKWYTEWIIRQEMLVLTQPGGKEDGK